MGKNKQSEQSFSSVNTDTTAIGIGQIALGTLVIIMAAFTTWITVWFIGLCLVAWGIIDLIQFFQKRSISLSRWRFSVGMLAVSCGVLLIFFPAMGAAALSIILAILFIMSGLYKVFGALSERPVNWGWVVLGGGLSIILGFFIFSIWPVTSFIILGVLVGIDIMLNGWSLLAAGYASRKFFYHHRGTPSGAHG